MTDTHHRDNRDPEFLTQYALDRFEEAREARHSGEIAAAASQGILAVLLADRLDPGEFATIEEATWPPCCGNLLDGEKVDATEAPEDLAEVTRRELTDALRYTVEYAGLETLPAQRGWAWYDAMVKYAPEIAERFAREQAMRDELNAKEAGAFDLGEFVSVTADDDLPPGVGLLMPADTHPAIKAHVSAAVAAAYEGTWEGPRA